MQFRRHQFLGLFLFLIFSAPMIFATQPSNQKRSKIISTKIADHMVGNQLLSYLKPKLKAFIDKAALRPPKTKIRSSALSLIPSVGSKGGMIPFPSSPHAGTGGINRIIFDKTLGTPRLIETQIVQPKPGNTPSLFSSPSEKAMQFLNDHKSLLKIDEPENEFYLESSQTDQLGNTHLKYQQIYKGFDIWGKEITLHVDKTGDVLCLTGRYEPTPQTIDNLSGGITSAMAIGISMNDLRSHETVTPLSPQFQSLLDYSGPKAKKVIWFDNVQQPHVSWFVEVRSGTSEDWYYFIDTRAGRILNSYNNICYDGRTTGSGLDLNSVDRTFGTYLANGNYYMLDASEPMFDSVNSHIPDNPIGAIQCFDLQNHDFGSPFYYVGSTTNQWNDPASISAQFNAITTYRFYHTIFGRNSIDDSGMTIYSFIHVTKNNQPMENAYWAGKFMCYGDGGVAFKPLAGGLDVGAHEMTHGVTQYSANLEYQDQSGALNESMSDAFGCLVDTTNWTIGEQIIKNYTLFPSGAMRDLSNPHNGGNQGDPAWQPASMNEYLNTTQDNGGVHTNSGIPNHAFYLVASSIGRSKAGQIWYRALTLYLVHSSQFLDARIATEKSAIDLFGPSSTELAAVQSAWDNVGVLEGTPPPPPSGTHLVGQNWILVTNTDPNDTNSLYMAKSVIQSSADLSPLTKTPILTRPAATDTSGIVFFVDRDYNLRAMSANPQYPQETLIDNHGVWWSVAIGPGLSSIALTSRFIDTTIYYIDLIDTTKSRAYKISTPSYDATDTKTALYADALSFDPTGQYLLFDTYNQIKSSSGDTIAFWNINLLDIKSGYMESAFTPQPQGIDIGNPSFSKTSPTRFAFDYVDNNSNRYIAMAADFNTGKIGIIADSNGTLGYPTYSGNDSAIAYHCITLYQSAYHDAIQQMPLQGDFITGTNNPQSYIVDATFPVWFVVGTRVTSVQDKPSALPHLVSLGQNYPNPFNPSTIISYSIPKASHVILQVFNLLGQLITTLVDEREEPGTYHIQFDGSKLTSGFYFYRITAGEYIETKKMILVK